jgi:two-component system NtrC family sensor kinase
MPRRSIRAKLTIGALIPFAVAMLVCSLTGFYLIDSRIAHQAREKVRTDINSARAAYQAELAHLDDILRTTADSSVAADAVASGERARIGTLLHPLEQRHQLDLLTVLDREGRVLFRAHNPAVTGDNLLQRRSIALALSGRAACGSELLTGEELAREQPDLAQRALVTPVATPHARQQPVAAARSGMFLVAAAPVRSKDGTIVGVVQGGILLNNNNELVDRIKKTVYEGVRYQGQDVGTATIFLDDLRIATNVLATDGKRAIGTRLSEEVYNQVVLAKRKWVGRAFVVNDWYITAYEPITNLDGAVIGSLYVGMLERPYSAIKRELLLIFSLVLVVCTIICLLVSGVIGAQLSRPVKTLEIVARRVAAGERNLQAEVRTGDELQVLADEFNEMTRALEQREAEIGELNRDLERKVAQRTAQLEEKNSQLLKTQADLARAEKLAGLGILAAGVAHEINNPLAIIRGNTEVLEMSLPPDHPQQEEVRIIARQIGRMAKIVGNLLSFARQKKLHRGPVALHLLLDDVAGQLSYQLPLTNIRIERRYAPDLDTISGDADQLRQVFANLMANAVQAMAAGGTLTLTTHPVDAEGTSTIEISDTGCGIAADQLERLFTPFFNTKETGSGLGLAVSYGIVKDHGGDITVTSTPGAGTTFRVRLPAGPRG